MTDNGKKVCKKCGKEKFLSEFPRCKGARDGYSGSCKACANLSRRISRQIVKEGKMSPGYVSKKAPATPKSLNELVVDINQATGSATLLKDAGGYVVGHYFVQLSESNTHACLSRVANSEGWFYDVFDCGFIPKDKLRKKMENYLAEIKQESSWVLDGKVKPEREK